METLTRIANRHKQFDLPPKLFVDANQFELKKAYNEFVNDECVIKIPDDFMESYMKAIVDSANDGIGTALFSGSIGRWYHPDEATRKVLFEKFIVDTYDYSICVNCNCTPEYCDCYDVIEDEDLMN